MYKITTGPGQGYTITVDSADALTKLLRGQTYTLPRHDGVKMLTYSEAQQIAVNADRSIPSSSLRSACQRATNRLLFLAICAHGEPVQQQNHGVFHLLHQHAISTRAHEQNRRW